MNKYRYVKVSPVTITVPIVPFFSIIIGFSILFWVVWPIASFTLTYAVSNDIITPLSDTRKIAVVETTTADFSRASAWFPKNPAKKTVTPVDTYALSIPKLGITKAMVKIGSDDLSKNLIHYGGTGLPGKEGNAVIFGHSVLPSFFDPKNYLTIFSLLPTLKNGDDIYVHFDGVDYRYKIVNKHITKPEDVSGLEQRFDDSYITLVTCVPPGTYLLREWITAKAVPFGENSI